MLNDPHISPLRDFVATLREQSPTAEFPDFDPLDGGVNAEILFVFEKPGPMTSVRGGGSGFISRDNDDPTAEATFRFMRQANIGRQRTIIWNAVPGWNGARATGRPELLAGVESLTSLLTLHGSAHTVVLVGKRAQRSRKALPKSGLRILECAHSSPLVKARRPDVWKKIPDDWAAAERVTGV